MSEYKEISEVIENAQIAIDSFKAKLKWNKEVNLKLVQCPHDSTHWVSSKNLQQHVSNCKWKVLGYTSDEANQIQESENMSNSKNLDIKGIIRKLFPDLNPMELLTYEKYTTFLSPQQRLELYEESVSLCKNVIKDNDPFLYENLDKEALKKLSSRKASPSNINVIKELRDFKRRRRTYRAKNVAITKRSYTEVLRDVLKTHMENLQKSLDAAEYIRFQRDRKYERDKEKDLSSKRRTADDDSDFSRKASSHKTPKSSRRSHHHQDDKRHEYERSEDRYQSTDHKAHKRKKSKKDSKKSKRKKDFDLSSKRYLK